MEAGVETTTGPDLFSKVEIEDQNLQRTWYVRVFAFLGFGGHGMGCHDHVQISSDGGN